MNEPANDKRPPHLVGRVPDRLGATSAAIAVAMVAWAAATSGAVEPWSEAPLVAAAAAAAVLGCVRMALGGELGGVLAPLALVAAFGGLAAYQLIPLGAEPASTADAGRATIAAATVSYYPAATAHGLRLVAIGAGVFFAIGAQRLSRDTLKLLLLGLFLVASAEGVLALLQLVELVGPPWQSNPAFGSDGVGTFINRSNFCQFVNLGIGAGLGLLLVRMSEDRQRMPGHRSEREFAALLQRHGWLLGGLVVQTLAVATSLSRNGLFGMVAAAVVAAALVSRERALGWRVWLLGSVAACCVAGVLLVGFDRVYLRVGQLENKAYLADRWEMAKATLDMAGDHWATGVGLNAFSIVFPAYDTTNSTALAEHADCDYAQLLAETGLPGALLIGSFLAAVGWRARRVLTTSKSPARHAVYGVVFALVAVGVQSLTDFGQRLPAVFMTTAALCGLCWAIPTDRWRSGGAGRRSTAALAAAGCLATVFLSISAWSIVATARDYRAYHWWAIADRLRPPTSSMTQQLSLEDHADRVAAAEAAASEKPGNVEYRFWTSNYRWELVLAASGMTEAEAAADPNWRAFTLQIADELAATRRDFPTYGPAWLLEARLRLLAGDTSGVQLARRAAVLARNSPDALLLAALVEATVDDGDRQRAVDLARRVVELTGSRFEPVAELCVAALNAPLRAVDFAGKDVEKLRALADVLKRHGGHDALLAEVDAKRGQLQVQRILSGDATAAELAATAAERAEAGDFDSATRLYREALGKDYANTRWRLALIDVLRNATAYEHAYAEAKTLLRLQPGHRGATRRLDELSPLVEPDFDREPDGEPTPVPKPSGPY